MILHLRPTAWRLLWSYHWRSTSDLKGWDLGWCARQWSQRKRPIPKTKDSTTRSMRRNIHATIQPLQPSASWGSVRRLALFVFMELATLFQKGAAITQSIVNHHVSCFRDFKMADLPPLAIQTKQQVLKHMAIHDLPNTRKESSNTGCVCNNKGKVQWSKLKFPANTGFDGLNLCGESSPHQKWQWSSGPPQRISTPCHV